MEKKRKKEIENSILISILDIKSNERYRLFSDSTISAGEIPNNILIDLEIKKYIQNTDIINDYVISAKGIWAIENKNNKINDEILLEYLDKKFFSDVFPLEKPLSDNQKVVLFSMIATRTFSEKSSVDLNKSENVTNTWKEIIDESYEKLKSLDLISKLDMDKLYGKGNDPVGNIFHRTDAIPRKTKGLFKAAGNKKYYLDIYKDSSISKDDLIFLFKQILENKELNTTVIDNIDAFCRKIANNKNIYLFDSKEHIFSKPEYDELIRNSLLFM